MKALILNSGVGSRMGEITKESPKCMTDISPNETIISRQLNQLSNLGIKEVIMTTGPFEQVLKDYCEKLGLDIRITFINNPDYKNTNYIYSIYCAREHLNDDILLMHGDIVCEETVLKNIINNDKSCVVVSSIMPKNTKDFKAVIEDDFVKKIGVEFKENVVASQPVYKLNKQDWMIWLNKIIEFCEEDNTTCYAENALNEVTNSCIIVPYDIKEKLCSEIDNSIDLSVVKKRLLELN
ncbi:MAG: NTP transferase domain-containing protein [Eubacterium sp.]|nr:NTP transferase domain-containing protein [Eubacterium sp.]